MISDGLGFRNDRSSDKEEESENSSSDKVPPVHKVELQIHSPPKQLVSESVTTSKPHENHSSVGKCILFPYYIVICAESNYIVKIC